MVRTPIADPSAKSLRLSMLAERPADGKMVALITGTGFTVMVGNRRFLITNLHNVTGRDSHGDFISSHGMQPTHVGISAWNGSFPDFGPVRVVQPLYQDAERQREPLWTAHPDHPEYDVVALEITTYEGVGRLPGGGNEPIPRVGAAFRDWRLPEIDSEDYARPYLRPGDAISIVGYPFGLRTKQHLPIWISGTIASEPELDYDSRPIFLVDARTRPGQSGSPVVLHLTPNSSAVLFTDNSLRTYRHEVGFLLGVYSGRLNRESDIGIIWKPSVVREILARALGPDVEL